MDTHLASKQTVLLVDDAPENLQVISSILYEQDINIAVAESGPEALELVARKPPVLILLDIIMPGMDGYEVCARLQQHPAAKDIPVIFLTAKDQMHDIVKGFACGAVDYVTKPFNPPELLARVLTHLELKQARDLLQARHDAVQETLQDTEALHQLILSNISDAVFMTNEQGGFTYICENVRTIFGYSPQEIWTLGQVDKLLNARQLDRSVLQTRQEIRNAECHVVDKFGHEHDLLVTMKQVAIKDGTVLYTCRDITERKQIEKALRTSERQYRGLVENVADGIGILQEGKLVFVNEALTAMLGFSAKQLLGIPLLDLVHEDHREIMQQAYEQLESGKDEPGWHLLQCIVRGDGREIWIEGRHSLIEWEGNRAILVSIRDISQHKFREIEIVQEHERLRRENLQLKSSIKERYRFGDIVGKSQPMQAVYELILKAAASDKEVLICGESGTGKELIAQTIHRLSARQDRAFIPVNCGAVPESIFEREFFGHRKGAFTGAERNEQGFFDAAHGGTLFLDEVGELQPAMQVKLLRAIEGGEYTPVGATTPKKVDVRMIAATHQDLPELVENKRMREDFFYRIHVIVITMPPLRRRKEDIPLLIDHFVREHTRGEEPPALPGHMLEALYNYDWPGNIRQLRNVLSRYLTVGHLDFGSPRSPGKPAPLQGVADASFDQEAGLRDVTEQFEKQVILRALEQHHWHRGHTAAALKVGERTLYRKMKQHRLI